ncbi:PREDICTED: probable 28S ribosomal protein S26, mitochondrial [Dinoponera quadriceps]|uniref:Small ribosomal subunit protein mS26 n=1 Tax=Dinoponera quadriceps TaxID=609295 RepID=A0A6P3XHB6_DINQU|nr:PREDICTED: probable 28S ribosomal protein S26, mitochondrial [Dinoponera quadriceps]XP_014477865.1 PREDICTED: probable 28S ribosomal protein S26, mitochondrial [Dinoponera quadriceps]
MMQATRMMMRSSSIYESFIPNSVYTQCIRWKRRPIWLPTGKKRIFRVPKRPVIPIEDEMELQRLYNNYRTFMRSLRLHITNAVAESEVQFDEAKLKQAEEEDFQACSAINDEWNANVAKIREAKHVELRETYKKKAFEKMVKREAMLGNLREQVDEKIRKAKEEAVTFITAENIDAMIEECLANVVDHNRAIDLQGNWYDGKHPAMPTDEKMATQSTVVQQ